MENKCFFILEQSALGILITKASDKWAEKSGKNLSDSKPGDWINEYFKNIRSEAYVTDEEINAYYEQHEKLFDGVDLENTKEDIHMFLQGIRETKAVRRKYKQLSQDIPVNISASWTAIQANAIKQTFLEKKRANGIPTVALYNKTHV